MIFKEWLLGFAPFFVVSILGLASASPVAFPGAQGFGAAATGGRGGTIYHVTNLNNSGTGSFRDAVGTSNRIIVFDVGGYVQLLSDVITGSNLTIAGQTAPGGGFGVFGAEVSFSGKSNCIVRHIRFRDGSLDPNWAGTSSGNSHTNCVNLGSTDKMIFDHCSFEFAAYNNIDATACTNLTFSNCIIADPIKNQQFNFHYETGPGTFIGNIFANAHNRSVLGKAGLQYVNNLIYNYQLGFTTGNSAGHFSYDIINNYFIAGPSTSTPNDAYFQVDSNQSAYAIGNKIDSAKNGTLTGSDANTVDSANVLSSYVFTSANTTFPTASLPTVSAAAAAVNDMANAGAFPRDQVDAQVISQVSSLGTSGKIFTTQADTGLTNSGYGTIDGGANPVDSDGDGMPDFWETARGFNPNSATDGSALASDGSGYTNLEEYLSWLAGPHATSQKNSSVQIDLSLYTAGLTGATYAVSSPVGGTVSVSGKLATFTPTANTVGLGSFSFTATGTYGTITNTVSVCTSSTSQPVSVTWVGDGTANSWDNTNASNLVWSTGTSAVAWTQGDTATLDDSGSRSPSINLASPIVAAAITVSTVNNYTIGGTGSLGGSASLTVNGYGTGSLTFSNSTANSMTGAVSISDATVSINKGNSMGTGPLTLNNATLVYTLSSLTLANSPITINTASTIKMHAGGTDFINGSISGTGPLNISLNSATNTLSGDMSGFTSTLTVIGPGSCRIDNSSKWGVANGILNITSGAGLNNRSAGAVTIPLGSLSGDAGTNLRGSDQPGASAGLIDTYTIGALNTSTTFAGGIVDGTNATNPHVTAIVKTGTGTLTLSGASTYTGTTTVSGGTLLVTGTLGNTTTTVASGCSLIGTGTIGTTTGGAVTMQSGSTLSPGSSGNTYATLTVGHGLSLAGVTIPLDLSNNPSGSNDSIVLQGGTLALSGSNILKINLVDGGLGAGVYTLIGGGTATTGSIGNISTNLPSGTRQTLSLTAPTSKVILTVTGSAASLTWTGANSGVWDRATTSNWSNGGSSDLFYTLDTANFNDSSANGAVTITGSVQPVAINVNNSITNYTFGGTGSIDGLATLTKSGSGTLTINNTGSNTFTGGATINGGTVIIGSGNSLGTGTITLNGGTLKFGASSLSPSNAINVTAASTLTVAGGSSFWSGALTGNSPLTLNLTSNGVFSPGGSFAGFSSSITLTGNGNLRLNQGSNTWGGSSIAFTIGATNSIYNRSAGDVTINLGSLSGPVGAGLGASDQAGPALDTYVIGALNTSTTFAGTISDSGLSTAHTVAITKVGTGTLTLSGAETYSGSTVVQAGTLLVSGSINSGSGTTIEVASGGTLNLSNGTLTTDTVLVDSGGSLTGGGTINGDLSNGGTFNANSGGTFAINGDVLNTGTFTVTNGTNLTANGNFINSGTLDLSQAGAAVIPNLINTGTIIAKVTLSNLSVNYDGNPHAATVTTNPASLSVTVTYNGSATAPTAVGSYTVVATVTSSGYQGSATGTLVIASTQQTFNQWKAAYSTTGATTTPQNDGVPNLLKYLYNIDPTRHMTAADRAALPVLGMTTTSGTPYLTLTYRQYKLETGVTINVQTSSDLKTWTTVTPDISQQIGTDATTGDPIMEVGVNVTSSTRKFIRLNVILP